MIHCWSDSTIFQLITSANNTPTVVFSIDSSGDVSANGLISETVSSNEVVAQSVEADSITLSDLMELTPAADNVTCTDSSKVTVWAFYDDDDDVYDLCSCLGDSGPFSLTGQTDCASD